MATDSTNLTFVRCPSCRSLVPAISTRCRMCGAALETGEKGEESLADNEKRASRIRQRTMSSPYSELSDAAQALRREYSDEGPHGTMSPATPNGGAKAPVAPQVSANHAAPQEQSASRAPLAPSVPASAVAEPSSRDLEDPLGAFIEEVEMHDTQEPVADKNRPAGKGGVASQSSPWVNGSSDESEEFEEVEDLEEIEDDLAELNEELDALSEEAAEKSQSGAQHDNRGQFQFNRSAGISPRAVPAPSFEDDEEEEFGDEEELEEESLVEEAFDDDFEDPAENFGAKAGSSGSDVGKNSGAGVMEVEDELLDSDDSEPEVEEEVDFEDDSDAAALSIPQPGQTENPAPAVSPGRFGSFGPPDFGATSGTAKKPARVVVETGPAKAGGLSFSAGKQSAARPSESSEEDTSTRALASSNVAVPGSLTGHTQAGQLEPSEPEDFETNGWDDEEEDADMSTDYSTPEVDSVGRGLKERSTKEAPRRESDGAGRLFGWIVSYLNPDGTATELREGRFFVSSKKLKESDLIIDDPSISTPHAMITVSKEEGLLIQDLMSDRGVFIRRRGRDAYGREEGIITVEHGDWVRFGDVEFLVTLIMHVGVE